MDVSLQACMFGRPSHDIPKGLSQSVVSQPQVKEVNAAATGAAVVWWDNLPDRNGMSEPNELQTVGRTGVGHHRHTKHSTHFG